MAHAGRTTVVATGNALIIDKQHKDVASQLHAAHETCRHIAGSPNTALALDGETGTWISH